MLSDAEFLHRLDISLVPVTKAFSSAAPLTDRFADQLSATASHARPLSTSQERPQSVAISAESLQAIARGECVSRVEGLQQWLERAQQGRRMGEECLSVLQSLSGCLASMREVTGAVQEQSDNLSSNASALMVRKTKLELVQEELHRMIHHYTHIEDLAREAEHPMLSATSARYPSMLQEMEEEMQFLSRNPQFLSSKTYAAKLALAQQRAHQCLREALVASMQAAQSATVESEEYQSAFSRPKLLAPHKDQEGKEGKEGKEEDDKEEDNIETNQVQLRSSRTDADAVAEDYKHISDALTQINAFFFARLEEKASLRRMVEARNSDDMQQDDDLWDAEILDAYREVRVGLVGPLLQESLDSWCGDGDAPARPLPRLVAHIAVLMRMALAREKELFDDVWLREDFGPWAFAQLVTGISNEVYDVFRSRLLQVDDVAELALAIEEVQRANAREGAVAELGGLLTKMVQDTQERLIFRTSVFLRQSIVRCRPTQAMAQQFLQNDCAGDTNPLDGTPKAGDSHPIGVGGTDGANFLYIPALTNCVTLLQLLYPSLEFSVFSVFAEEAIHCALTQVQELAKLMGQQRIERAAFKGLLCQLQHLLHLREELSGIDENITVVEKCIDLTKIAQRRIEIVQFSRESKKDVEGEIKVTRERVIQMLINEISLPLAGVARKGPSEISAALQAVGELRHTYKRLLESYLTSASAREALLRPVNARIDELLGEAAAIQRQKDPQQQLEEQSDLTRTTEELPVDGDGSGALRVPEDSSSV